MFITLTTILVVGVLSVKPPAKPKKQIVHKAIKLHRGKESGAMDGNKSSSKETDVWLNNNCQGLVALKKAKKLVMKKLDGAIGEVHKDKSIKLLEKKFRIHMFEIFKRELNESEDAIQMSFNGLKRALQVRNLPPQK